MNSSSNTHQGQLPTDIYAQLLKIYRFIRDKKISFPIVTIFLAVFTFLKYVYSSSYNEYFGISDTWLDTTITNEIYDTIIQFFLYIAISLPNVVSIIILLWKNTPKHRVNCELVTASISVIIFSGLRILFVFKLISYNLAVLIGTIWIGMLVLPIWMMILYDIISFIAYVFPNFMKCSCFFFEKIKHPFKTFKNNILNLSKSCERIYIIVNSVSDTSDHSNWTDEQRIRSRNNALISLVTLVLIICTFFTFYFKGKAIQDASSLKTFKVIELINSNETKDDEFQILEYENLREGIQPGDTSPYIFNNMRTVNAYVILKENESYLLVANAYVSHDDETNTNELYIFCDEQRIIDANNRLVVSMTFANAYTR